MTVAEGKITLPFDAIAKSIVVKEAGGTGDAYELGTDYDLIYNGGELSLIILEGGGIPAGAASLNVAYSVVDREAVTADDIIGGVDVETNQKTGLELLYLAFIRHGVLPDLIIAPGFSHIPEVAAVMEQKIQNYCDTFKGKALVELDMSSIPNYTDAPDVKNRDGINGHNQYAFYGFGKRNGRTYHLSTLASALIAAVDMDNECPCDSPSNKAIDIEALVDSEGNELWLDIPEVNCLNKNGIMTALNFNGKYVLWGNESAAFPSSEAIEDAFICNSRMLDWVSNTIVLTTWAYVDGRLNRREIESIADMLNIWFNGLVADGKMYGGRAEYHDEKNPTENLIKGKFTFDVWLFNLLSAKEIQYHVGVDLSYLTNALSA